MNENILTIMTNQEILKIYSNFETPITKSFSRKIVLEIMDKARAEALKERVAVVMPSEDEIIQKLRDIHDELANNRKNWGKGQVVGIPPTSREDNCKIDGFEHGINWMKEEILNRISPEKIFKETINSNWGKGKTNQTKYYYSNLPVVAIIDSIESRIKSEFDKHKNNNDWAKIAAHKICAEHTY